MQLFFQKSKIISDSGLLVTRENAEEFYFLSNTRELVESGDDNREEFMNFSFQIDNIQKDYIRKYKKIQDVAAEVGGIMKLLFLLMSLFVKPIVKRAFKLELVRKALGEEYLKKDKDLKQNKISGALHILKNKFNLNIDELRYKKAIKFLEERLDIRNIFNKFIELDRLSFILLKDQQLQSFKKLCANEKKIWRLIDSPGFEPKKQQTIQKIPNIVQKSEKDSLPSELNMKTFKKGEGVNEFKYSKEIDDKIKLLLKTDEDDLVIEQRGSIYEIPSERNVNLQQYTDNPTKM